MSALVVGTSWTYRIPLLIGTFRVAAATLEVSEASKLGQEMTTTPLKNVPSALKSVSLMVVRGGVAPSFELSAKVHSTRTHSRPRSETEHSASRHIPCMDSGFRVLMDSRRHEADRAPLERINFRRGKDFGREEF